MLISFLQKKLKDTSISRKLYFTVGIMAILVSLEMCTLWFAVSTLSSVRAYVEGEGLWSKAQKDAVYHLRMYALSHDENDYYAFRKFLNVPLGDKKARLALGTPNPDLNIARQGFIEGRNHPDDVDGMINLITRFHSVSYINNAFVIWGQAEQKMEELIPLGEKMHVLISKQASQTDINNVLGEAENINGKLTKLEDNFSFTLSEGSRWLENIVLRLLLALSLTIGSTSILITISVSRGIERGLKAILDGAALIRKGLLSTRVEVYSGDEIGVLATEFNVMTAALESNIQELTDTQESLKREKERAETSEKIKQMFLANMSHEIRTPMNAILGFARLLEEIIAGKEEQEYLKVIIKSGDDLLVIINDILDFSKLEAGKITFESAPFNLRDTVNSIVAMMGPKATSKDLKITSDIDACIPEILVGDAVRLNQILLNLISNAVKFTDQGEIDIALKTVDESDDNIIIEFIIKDTGIGIPIEKQEKIFESFEQASASTSRRFGGTGLGLSIVKQLVEMQDGSILVDSQPDKGATFIFRLSFLKSTSAVQAFGIVNYKLKPLVDDQHGKGINVLIVEDNPVNQYLTVKVLENHGFNTDVAENGRVALSKIKGNNYDIVLMDLQMPEIDGYDATINIREFDDYKKDLPIIAMTAHTIQGEKQRCMDIGMTDYISKPFNANELFEKIHKLVKKPVL